MDRSSTTSSRARTGRSQRNRSTKGPDDSDSDETGSKTTKSGQFGNGTSGLNPDSDDDTTTDRRRRLGFDPRAHAANVGNDDKARSGVGKINDSNPMGPSQIGNRIPQVKNPGVKVDQADAMTRKKGDDDVDDPDQFLGRKSYANNDSNDKMQKAKKPLQKSSGADSESNETSEEKDLFPYLRSLQAAQSEYDALEKQTDSILNEIQKAVGKKGSDGRRPAILCKDASERFKNLRRMGVQVGAQDNDLLTKAIQEGADAALKHSKWAGTPGVLKAGGLMLVTAVGGVALLITSVAGGVAFAVVETIRNTLTGKEPDTVDPEPSMVDAVTAINVAYWSKAGGQFEKLENKITNWNEKERDGYKAFQSVGLLPKGDPTNEQMMAYRAFNLLAARREKEAEEAKTNLLSKK